MVMAFKDILAELLVDSKDEIKSHKFAHVDNMADNLVWVQSTYNSMSDDWQQRFNGSFNGILTQLKIASITLPNEVIP